MQLEAILKSAPVIPVLVIENVFEAVPLARALVKGGLPVLEITLRTQAAFDCIRAIKAEVKDAIVGAGTVLTTKQLEQTEKLGCAFAVSPGATPKLIEAARNSPVHWLPAAATASEAMVLLDAGFNLQKFFPAEPAGGPAYLSSLSSPLPSVRFCPTGGITAATAPKYLALSNVITVGGSWMAPHKQVASKDWKAIEAYAKEAKGLGAGLKK
jgi:2-dehydro-3-deoxyphosphogluconate aldolase / (4S)-4-hydroxy-2-oxoglutarate aldolase